MRKLFARISDYLGHADLLLYAMFLSSSVLSVLCITAMAGNENISRLATVSYRTAAVQLGAICIGGICAILFSHMDYHTLAKLWKLHLPVCIVLVLVTFTQLGLSVGEADDVAWIGLGLMSLQPTELLKISFILTFAYHLSYAGKDINSLRNTLLLGLHAGSLVLLTHFQGDDGTALIFVFIFLSMMFAAGWSLWYFLAGIGATGAVLPLVWMYVMNADQKGRISALYKRDPTTAGKLYQQERAVLAIGSGGVVGNGLFSGNYTYVPSMRNDFIFSFIGNALGFVGCMVVVLMLMGICLRVLWISHLAHDDLGRFICIGVFAMIASQALLNIGMNLMLVPVVGVTLPLFSAGGTSVLGIYLGMAAVQSVRIHSRHHLFI